MAWIMSIIKLYYGHMDNQTLLKHKISNSLMVSVIHNSNQYLHLNASLISSSISPSWISLAVLLSVSLSLRTEETNNHLVINQTNSLKVMQPLPSWSTSPISSCNSPSEGDQPNVLMTWPSSTVVMVPPPSLDTHRVEHSHCSTSSRYSLLIG